MAKDVITRFKLETTQYDSKLKTAAKGLADFSKTATQAGAGFQDFTRKNIEAARALGTTATSTTNAKDRVKELVGAYNEAAKAYNQLTAQQQQSDWAKALSGSLAQLQQRIRETKQEMQSLGDANGKMGGLFGGGNLDGMLQVFGGNLMTKGASMLAGLASEMGDCIKQGIELARQGEGIRNAFERLNNPGILDSLREATHGTVTDIELMKAAVKFNDFKLPIEELGTMLAFAQQKAKDTGQSVDYMVDSIVTGLGRKSLMILDNLGLSAAEIKDKMAETGDMTKAVGEIIREQMANAGDYVETAADRAAQANVSLQNKMEELGRKFAPLQEASNNLWTSMKIGIMDVIAGPLTNFLNKLTEAGRLANQYGVLGGNDKVGRLANNLSNASEGNRQSIYQQQLTKFWKYINPREQQLKDIRAWQRGERGEALQSRVNAITEKYGSLDATKIQAEMDAAKKMLADYQQAAKTILNPVKADIDTKGAQQSVESLRVKLAELEAQRKKAIESGDQDKVKNLTQQINQTKTSIKALDPTALKTTHTATKQEQAQKSVDSALQKYNDAVTLAAKEMEAGVITEADYKNKLLSGQQRLYDAYGTAYQTYADPKYKEAQDKAAEEIVKLGDEVNTATEAQRAAMKAARELEQAQKKLADAQTELATAQASGDLRNIYAAEKKVEAARQDIGRLQTITVEVKGAEALEQLKNIEGVKDVKVDVEQGEVNLPEVPTDVTQTVTVTVDDAEAIARLTKLRATIIAPVKVETPKVAPVPVPLTTANLDAFIGKIKEEISNEDVGGIDATKLMERMSDASKLSSIIQYAMQSGIDMTDMSEISQALWQKLLSGQDIQDGIISGLLQQVGDATGKDLKQGEDGKIEEKQDKSFEDFAKDLSTVTGGLSSVSSGLKSLGVDMPKEFNDLINVLNGVGQIISGVQSVISLFATSSQAANTAAVTLNTTAIAGLIAALEVNTAASFIPFANGGIIPRFAGGGLIGRAAGGMMIPGNSFSGDNLRVPVDGGRGFIGVNSGEVILNRAQVGNLSSQLQGGGMGQIQLSAVITGEQLRLILNNNSRRTGRGEYVTTNFR